MVFSRKFGHKIDLPGLGQWRLQNAEDHKCWVCEHQIYTLVFLTETFARRELESFPKSQFESMVSQIKKFNLHIEFTP